MRLLGIAALAGALLPACGSPLTCPSSTTQLTYSDVQPVFTAHCTTCHSSTSKNRQGAPSDVNFDTYAAAKSAASQAKSEIVSRDMPPPGNASMTDADRCTLTAWIGQGTPP